MDCKANGEKEMLPSIFCFLHENLWEAVIDAYRVISGSVLWTKISCDVPICLIVKSLIQQFQNVFQEIFLP